MYVVNVRSMIVCNRLVEARSCSTQAVATFLDALYGFGVIAVQTARII